MCAEEKLRAIELFERLQTEFPNLVMEIRREAPDDDVDVTIRQQAGLAFDVYLNLQNHDELYLGAGAFWCSWFPSSKPAIAKNYHNAVTGVLSGRDRVVEYVRRCRAVGADLQTPHGDGWKTIARSRANLLPLSWFSEKRVLINK